MLCPLAAKFGGERVSNTDRYAYFSCVVVASVICAVRIIEFSVCIVFPFVPTLVALTVPLLLLPLFRPRHASPEQCIPDRTDAKFSPPLAPQQRSRP